MPSHEGYIASAANPRVKEWAKLKERKYREREGLFLLEGVHLVKEALQAGWPLVCVAYDAGLGVPEELVEWSEDAGAAEHAGSDGSGRRDDAQRMMGVSSCSGPAWTPVSPEIIAKCSQSETPQPVFAVAGKSTQTAMDSGLFNRESALVVVLDGVQDPGNVGTIVRSAAACGATGVILGRGTADLYNAKTLRATMGALFHIPVIEADLTELLPQAQDQEISIAGTSLQATRSCYDYDFRRGAWLVFGNEGSGLSPDVAASVNEHIIIPMTGHAESLNVAMAATVLLFEAQRQRMQLG